MSARASLLLSDECWVALAILHRKEPGRISFTAREILDQVKEEGAHPELRPGVQPHIYQHNVANVPPSSGRYRMFYRLEDGTFRLYRPGDDFHPSRRGKTRPERSHLPVQYHSLLDWYEREYCAASQAPSYENDPVLAMRGVGKEIWEGIDSDAFIRELRSGWPTLDSVLDQRAQDAAAEAGQAGSPIATSRKQRGG